MNPGKIVDPYPMDACLRKGPDTLLPAVNTNLDFPEDDHSFSMAANRCVGIGVCRDFDDGVMCPSYRATMEEKDCTRGRARMLFEMLKGDVISDGWRSKAVRESLDLCLSCKACKTDCPVGVDMAAMKAEFMSHHYRHRLRPVSAYSMGLIWWWSRIAARVPSLVNAVTQTPGISKLFKWVGGIAPQRNIPPYADVNFTKWFAARDTEVTEGRRVVLWPDTFNNYFYPDTLKAAVRVLEAAGCQVEVPPRPLCCALPLFAEGMLELARVQLRQVLDTLERSIMENIPVVGLEPSCVASFRDELPQLFPADERAHKLASQSFLLSEYLEKIQYRPRRLTRRALIHIHCHQHASLDVNSERTLFRNMGLDYRMTPNTCCGMAGSFGFKNSNFEVSQRIAEHKLLPAVNAVGDETLIVTNGFSCREQIRQSTGRTPLNLSELLELSLREGDPVRLITVSDERSGGREGK
ncbi:MAG: (Fe-S)-binding protein [Pseudohongiellaceae bacterium]